MGWGWPTVTVTERVGGALIRRRGKRVRGGDRRTGYYVAGRDWPAIPDRLSTSDTYEALEAIDDDDIRAAQMIPSEPPESSTEHASERPTTSETPDEAATNASDDPGLNAADDESGTK